jgi:hypothetical protein
MFFMNQNPRPPRGPLPLALPGRSRAPPTGRLWYRGLSGLGLRRPGSGGDSRGGRLARPR